MRTRLAMILGAATVVLACASTSSLRAATDGNSLSSGVMPGRPHPVVSPVNADVFKTEADGAIRHIQSGLLCPAKFGAVTLRTGTVFPSESRGSDVGCDYGRELPGSTQGLVESKLTIFAVRAEAGTTLDSAFARYRGEMHQTHPDGRNAQPSVRMSGQVPANFPAVRSEEMDVSINGHAFKTEVIVFLQSGWIVEIRSTYPTAFTAGDPNIGVDIPNATAALLQAVSTVVTRN